MVRRLEKLAEASKNVFGKAVLGTSLSLAALTFSPDRAEGQNQGKWLRINAGPTYQVYSEGGNAVFLDESTCYARSVDLDNVKKKGDTYFVFDEDGAGGNPWYDNSYYVDGCSNSSGSRNRSGASKALRTANDVANIAAGVAAIVDLFSGNDNSGNDNSGNTNPDRNVRYRNPDKAEDSPYVDNSSGSNKENENSSSSPYSNESANVRNSQGERHESPYVSDKDSSSGESLYEMNENNDGSNGDSDVLYETSNDDWVGGDAPPLEPHERRAKEFFGGVRINTSSKTMYEVGLLSRTAIYDAISWVPKVGDAKDIYVDHLSTKEKTDAADYWRGKILPERVEESLDRLDRKTVDYRESSTVKISF